MLQPGGACCWFATLMVALLLAAAAQTAAASPLAQSEPGSRYSEYDEPKYGASPLPPQQQMEPLESDSQQPYDAEDGSDYDQDAGGEQEPVASGDAPLFGNWTTPEGQSSEEVALFLEFLAGLLQDLKTSKPKMNVTTALALSNARVQDRRLCSDPFFKHFFGISACAGPRRLAAAEADVASNHSFKAPPPHSPDDGSRDEDGASLVR